MHWSQRLKYPTESLNPPIAPIRMKSLDRLIALADLRGSLDLRCLLQGDWRVDHAKAEPDMALYHIVLSGHCVAQFEDRSRLELKKGDLLLLPRGASHVLSSLGDDACAPPPAPAEARTTTTPDSLVPIKRIGHEGELLDMLCGSIRHAPYASLFAGVPDRILVPAAQAQDHATVDAIVTILRNEIDASRPGSRTVIDALSTVLFALAMREHLKQRPDAAGTLSLLSDRRMAAVLQAMLDDPGRHWRVEDFAERAAMSRASFMRAFTRLAGTTPAALLAAVRMECARELLLTTDRSLARIALDTGYESEAAFGKKFSSTYGQPPGRFRQCQRVDEA